MKAADYRKLASKARAADAVIDVTLPSGAVWKMKEPPVQQWMLAGRLPSHLTVKMLEAAQNGDTDLAEIQSTFKAGDVMAIMELRRDLILHCAVEPRISLDPQTDNEIAPEDILPEDFEFLGNWVLSGGKSGESLTTFRPE